MNKAEATHRVVYYVQARVEALVVCSMDGVIIDAEDLLRSFKGRTLDEVRQKKMVTKIEVLIPPVEVVEAPPALSIQLTDME